MIIMKMDGIISTIGYYMGDVMIWLISCLSVYMYVN